MEISTFLFILTYLIGFLALCYTLLLSGVFDNVKGAKGLESDVKVSRAKRKHDNGERNTLRFRSLLCDTFSFLTTESIIDDTESLIARQGLYNCDGRLLNYKEHRGKYIEVLFFGIVFSLLGVVFSMSRAVKTLGILFILFGVFNILHFFLYLPISRLKISDEDALIDKHFLDLYLLLYSALRRGSSGHLQPELESYMHTLSTSNSKVYKTMLNFATYFCNNVILYGDFEALTRLQQRYTSATVVNFCNIAAQALNGVENKETLLSFKISLVNKRKEAMVALSNKLQKKSEIAIYLIYAILFLLIGVTFWSILF